MSYTNVSAIEALLSIDITSGTTPSEAQTDIWITQIETGMKASRLGSQTTVSGTKFDVTPTSAMAKDTIAWFKAGLPASPTGREVVPPFTPIISVTSGTMYRNKAGLNQTEDWDQLSEGPGEDTDFIIRYDVNKKTNKRVGNSFYFYGSLPSAGKERIMCTWVYGHNIDTEILQEYATLKTSEKVILARITSAQPMNLATYTGGDFNTFVNTQYEAWLDYIEKRTTEIEEMYFPRDVPIAIMK